MHLLLPAVMLPYYCWFSETTTRGTVCIKGLPLMAVCASFVWGVEHGDAFYKGFSDTKKKQTIEIEELANLRS